MQPLADQSVFVMGAINGVVREALIAACLTALMILIFLGNWRSTLIIATSIPLAILTSIIVLSLTGQTINIMTLGGLALAVGILVDDATVEVENINRNREAEPDKDLDEVVLDSAMQIATPAFVSTLSICIVFAPMFLLSGRGALSVSASGRGRGVCHAGLLFPVEDDRPHHGQVSAARAKGGRTRNGTAEPVSSGFSRNSNRDLRPSAAAIAALLERCLHHRRAFLLAFFAACLGSLAVIVPWLGQDFFPSVDAGSFKLHMRGPTGMRIEDTAFLCDQVEDPIRKQIPADEDGKHHRQHRLAVQRH